MPSASESPESCLERAGFLFAHDCPRPASRRCACCAKALCAQHTHQEGGQELCTGCLRAPPLLATSYAQGHGYYGRGAWSDELLQDPHDFTEADGEALRQPLEAQRFEEDMQGS